MPDNFEHLDIKSNSLLTKIAELEEVIRIISLEKNSTELLDFPWVGNLGQWFWMVPSNQVIFNDKKVTNLGYKIEDLPEVIGFDFFTSLLHPDDYQRVMENMKSHMMGLTDSYEVEYRIMAKSGEYIWYYDRGKITKRDENGKPLVISGIVFDINKNKLIEQELLEANKKLQILVNTDALTGAYNRRYILNLLKDQLKIVEKNNLPVSVIMIDIDHFKRVNDQFGHDKGDLVLTNIVNIIQSKCTNKISLSRWGGEEFVIILPEIGKEEATSFAESIRLEICNNPIESIGVITASFGVSTFASGDDVNSIVNRADDLMYKSKIKGRNQVSYS